MVQHSARYESCIDVELQQRAVEYFALSRKGPALMDILAEMPKFPERQVCVFNYKKEKKKLCFQFNPLFSNCFSVY